MDEKTSKGNEGVGVGEGGSKRVKLYELIAVKANLRQQAQKTMEDLGKTFDTKKHHFEQRLKVYTPDGEDKAPITEETSDLQTTVAGELKWVSDFIIRATDVSYQCTLGDTAAFADIVLEDGTTIATHVPSIMLLELEDRLEALRGFSMKIPTLDPAKGFKPDAQREKGIYEAREVVKRRTAMRTKPLVLYPATTEHPAQTQVVTEQVEVGTIREQEWSSMLTPAQKGDIIHRVESLVRAVKAARSRANETQVDTSKKIGAALIGYAFGLNL